MAIRTLTRFENTFGEGSSDPGTMVAQAKARGADKRAERELERARKEYIERETSEEEDALAIAGHTAGGAAAGAAITAAPALAGPQAVVAPLTIGIGALIGALSGAATGSAIEAAEAEQQRERAKSDKLVLGTSPRAQAAQKIAERAKYDAELSGLAAKEEMAKEGKMTGRMGRAGKRERTRGGGRRIQKRGGMLRD